MQNAINNNNAKHKFSMLRNSMEHHHMPEITGKED